MKIEETSHRLVVRDNPALFWTFACLFLVTGCICLYLSTITIEDRLAQPIAAVIGLSHIAGGTFMLWKEPASVVELDSMAGRLRLTRWSVFGRTVEEMPLDAVAGADVEVSEHTDGGPVYRPRLILQGGQRKTVSQFWYQREEPSASVAERLNAFVNNPQSSWAKPIQP